MSSGGFTASEAHLLRLLRRSRRAEQLLLERRRRAPDVASELRALEFWRALIAECLATFVYVFVACGAHVAWPLHHAANTLTKSACSGFAMAAAAHAFGRVSGAHANPALTLAMLVTRRITPLRALLCATAQCGGSIAGAALLYGVTPSPGIPGLGCTLVDPSLSPWRAAALEAVLTFVVGLSLFASDPLLTTHDNNDALAMGVAYLACSLVAMPATGASMNPARSLGPAFVMNTWTHHWVYWCGPATGGVLAGLIYEYIFDSSPRRMLGGVEEGATTDHKDVSEMRDDGDSKSSSGLSVRPTTTHQPPPQQQACFRALPPEGISRPHSRGPAKYAGAQVQQSTASYYSTVPRGGANGASSFRPWGGSEYGSSQQFKF